ncbi:glycosyltransferase [Candidatus Magnetobacterium bavaricum]|uniref:Glycosyltransferase n=1 Tax=Candidatus Magnetobacterium bavaricum TaxID=29290 RepID=A0A0F3GTH5_9BACT|nr:glycosyltransferase [Candidatus Magnetobacterium bavaricum]
MHGHKYIYKRIFFIFHGKKKKEGGVVLLLSSSSLQMSNSHSIEEPLVSVVMLCYNRREDAREGLLHLTRQSYKNLDIVVVDNCSRDGTAEMVQQDYPDVTLIRMPKNIGVDAYNEGFRRSRGDYVIILDDDSFPSEGSIKRMVEKFQDDPTLGIVAFDVRDYALYDNVCPETTVTLTATDSNSQASSGVVYIMSFNGAGAGVRREILDRVGGYPGEFFLYANELDLAFRVWEGGYRIEFFPDVVAYHKTSAVNRLSERAPFYYTRNTFWLTWKHYPFDVMLKANVTLMYHVFYHTLEQSTTVYLRAFADAISRIGQIRKKRKPVRREIASRMRVPLMLPFTMYR